MIKANFDENIVFRNVLSVTVEDSWRFDAGQNWPKLANVTFHGNWEGAEWEGTRVAKLRWAQLQSINFLYGYFWGGGQLCLLGTDEHEW